MTSNFILFFFLLCCSAFFSASETALFSLSRVQIYRFRSSKSRIAQRVVACCARPRKWLATILLGNELANISISIIGASIINRFFSYDVKVETVIAVVIITPVILLFGEIIPKNIAIRNAAQIAPVVIVPLGVFHGIVKPFRIVLTKIADFFVLLLGGKPEKTSPMIMEEEFRRLVDLGTSSGILIAEEREMIHKVFDFSDKKVSGVMTDAKNIFSLPIDIPYEEMLIKIKDTNYSRIPMYEGASDNIIGILHVRDLFAFHRKRMHGGEQHIRNILQKPLFVPPDEGLEVLLRDFQQSRIHMAIVMKGDKAAGIVAMHDILEALFGEMGK